MSSFTIPLKLLTTVITVNASGGVSTPPMSEYIRNTKKLTKAVGQMFWVIGIDFKIHTWRTVPQKKRDCLEICQFLQ